MECKYCPPWPCKNTGERIWGVKVERGEPKGNRDRAIMLLLERSGKGLPNTQEAGNNVVSMLLKLLGQQIRCR